jgi:RNase P protein component
MREAVRAEGGPWAGWDLLLIARAPIADAKMELVRDDLHRLLKKNQIGTPSHRDTGDI